MAYPAPQMANQADQKLKLPTPVQEMMVHRPDPDKSVTRDRKLQQRKHNRLHENREPKLLSRK